MSRTSLLTVFIFILACSWAFSRPPQPQAEVPSELKGVAVFHLPEKSLGKSPGEFVVVRSVSYQEVNLDQLALNLLVGMNAVDRPATVRKMYFQDLRANGLPVHIEPYDTEFQLSRTAVVPLPTPLRLSFVFADIDSLDPLRQLVSQSVLHLTGRIFILVQLSKMESAVEGARLVSVPLDLDQTVPMRAFTDEPMIQSAVLRMLDFFSAPYSTGAAALAKQHQEKVKRAQVLKDAAAGRLFLVYCSYSLRNRKTHDVQRFVASGTAFLIDTGDTLLTAKRVVQPWKFDSQAASLMAHSGYGLDSKAYRIAVWPAEAQVLNAKGELDLKKALNNNRHRLELWKMPADVMEQKPTGGANLAELVSVHTEGANDLALLKIIGQANATTPLAAASEGESPSPATLLGFPYGTNQERAALQQSTVRVETPTPGNSTGLIRLTRELNPGEAGGPMVTADGKVIAICAGPRTCVPLAAALRSLAGATALAASSVSGGKNEVTARFDAERREPVVISLEAVNESLGGAKHELPPEGVWQQVMPGGAFYTSDAARLMLLTSGDHPPKPSQVTWYQRASPDAPWQVLGSGAGLEFRIAAEPGVLLIRAEVASHQEHLSTAPVQYEIKQRLCSLLSKTILDDIALGVTTFREAKATTRTYAQAFAAKENIPQQIALLPDPDDPQKRPYQLADGDVVLRTGGPMGYMQRALGSPQSPQNHSGLIKIEHYQGKNIYMVNEIGWGYEYTPLTPADATAYQLMKSLASRPESFMEGANVGTLEVYRPVGMVDRSEFGKAKWQPYPIGQVAAARAVEIGAKAQVGYDFLFMESSPLADQPPFQNLYYCHEFTREAFGRRLAKPAPIPILQDLWKATRTCDGEMAAANAKGMGSGPAELGAVLAQIDVDHITFDSDPGKDKTDRNDFRSLINSLQLFLKGEPFEQIVKSKIAEQIHDESYTGLASEIIKGHTSATGLGPTIRRVLSDTSLSELAKASGLPEGHSALLGAVLHPAVQAWMATDRMKAAAVITDELIEDLGNAIDAKSLLAGGEATGAHGESVRVAFKRISANMP